VFEVERSEYAEKTLEVIVLDARGGEEIGRELCLGQVLIPLDDLQLSTSVWLWKGISPYVKQQEVMNEQCWCLF